MNELTIYAEYRKLYEEHIVKKANVHIIRYSPQKHNYEYKPFSHKADPNAIEQLSKLIIDNLVFYTFSEEEIVYQNSNYGILEDLYAAAKYAYNERLPKRKDPKKDGTTGEVLLDILIQVFEPMSQKLIARAKYKQQSDNNEIKGYDALYFTKYNNDISLWLGQVKTGSCYYCKSKIVEDLNSKYILKYFCNSLFYLADKADKSNELKSLLDEINKIFYNSYKNKWDDKTKQKAVIDLLNSKNVKIKIPCLLAYTEDIYLNEADLDANIKKCVNEMINEFDTKNFLIDKDLEYELIFCIFPVKNINDLRTKITDFNKGV